MFPAALSRLTVQPADVLAAAAFARPVRVFGLVCLTRAVCGRVIKVPHGPRCCQHHPAFTAVQTTIENNTIKSSERITEPTLFYSRPKGTYVGKLETEKVMLDFYPVNATLGENYSVEANINGEIHSIDKWQPYYITGLPMGENTIELTLVNKNGDPVESEINPVSRTFTLKEAENPVEQK